jgi:hypothetical protein
MMKNEKKQLDLNHHGAEKDYGKLLNASAELSKTKPVFLFEMSTGESILHFCTCWN